ncbi:MAG: 16S rRNA (guanine(527)-N(7))-methyltransferase RsmG [Actinomycetota bacterium]|nr:16S rRNA (guanine(527)-N(7))-methyltransferase RsmG [Actinomycetota bacterium]
MKHAPETARAVLGARADDLVGYATWLDSAGIERGLLGPREASRLWERHLLNCAVVAEAVPADADVIDVGSGAGLPGLVWAIVRPDLRVTVVEPLLRRTSFLQEVVADLGLRNVDVRRARAQDLGRTLSADVVTSRAVAPLARLADWCLPLVRPGGAMWAMKGESAARELTDALGHLQRAGAGDAYVTSYGEGSLEQPARVVHVKAPDRSENRGDRPAAGR